MLATDTPHVVTLPLLPDDALTVGALAAHLGGSLGLAHAIREVRRTRALLLTARAAAIRKVVGELHGLVALDQPHDRDRWAESAGGLRTSAHGSRS